MYNTKDNLIYASSARKAILRADPKLAYVIDNVPAVDAKAVVRGRWEEHPRDTFARENHCEKIRCTHCWHFYYRHYGDGKNYCTYCGADMRDGDGNG